MIFTDIRLQNFRSYTDESFEFGPGVTIVVGPNAAGKTNLIEALIFIAIGSTYRANNQVIQDNKEWARVDVHTKDNEVRTVKFTPTLTSNQKTFEIEEKTYSRLPATKKQPVVLFEPNDLLLLHGEPAIRRRFLDTMISQLAPGYSPTLNKYKRALAQRNSLLKNITSTNQEIFVWNVKLAELATEIVRERIVLLEQINTSLSEIYSLIADKPTNIKAEYLTNTNIQNYASSLLAGMEKNLEIDKLRGFTSLGPHRDDIGFDFEKKAHVSQASRGESRSLVLALKIIELGLIEQKTGLKPLLLLDDVFSELDGLRRKTLTNYLKNHQTIITSTDADIVMKNFSKSAHLLAIG